MRKIDREFQLALPGYDLVKTRRHIKIIGPCGCVVAIASGTPSDTHAWLNTLRQVRRHACRRRALAPAI